MNFNTNMMNMNQNGHITKQDHPIPENMVGLVIGKNGMEIQSISQQSACRLQVNSDTSLPGFRMVEIWGVPENIERAKNLIDDLLSRSVVRQTAPNPAYSNDHRNSMQHQPFGNFQDSGNGGERTIEIMIPASKCGSIIGKGGDNMRKLRNWSNCQIHLIQESNVADSDKPLRITGEPRNVEQARRLVIDMLANTESEVPTTMGANGGVNAISIHVAVPRRTVGAIMGLNGSNVKRLSDETGTKIQFLPEDDQNLVERTLAIVGVKSKVHVAAQLIKAIVENSNEEANKELSIFYLSIPAQKAGLVIGRGGEMIKQINLESGAQCELSREASEDPNEKTFILRGSDNQVEHAKHLIAIKVGDIPAGTPFFPIGPPHPPSHNYPVPQQPQPMSPMQYHAMQQQQHAQMQQQQQQMRQQRQMQYQQQQQQAQAQAQANVQMWTGQPIIQNPLPYQQQMMQQQQYGGPPQQYGGQQAYSPQPSAIPIVSQTTMAALQQMQQQKHQQLLMQQQQEHQLQQRLQQQQQHQHQLQQLHHIQQFSQNLGSPNTYAQQPQQQFQQQPQQQQRPVMPVASPSEPVHQETDTPGLSRYAQMVKQLEAEQKEKKAAAAKAAAQAPAVAPVATPKTTQEEAKKDNEEEKEDYSEQWYQYYLSLNDLEAAEQVRERIEEIKKEKEKKKAAAAAASSSSR